MKEHNPKKPLYRKKPRQQRAKVTVDIILQAATKLICESDDGDFNTNRLAAVAGVSIGTIYQYYSDKQAIVADICRRLIEKELSEIDDVRVQAAAQGEHSLEQAIGYLIERMLKVNHQLYSLLRSHYLRAYWQIDFFKVAVDEDPDRRTAEVWLAEILNKYQQEITIDNSKLAAELVYSAIEGAIFVEMLRRPEQAFESAFKAELNRLAMRYLKSDL